MMEMITLVYFSHLVDIWYWKLLLILLMMKVFSNNQIVDLVSNLETISQHINYGQLNI